VSSDLARPADRRSEINARFSLSPDQNDTSSVLDLLRWGASQAVCVGHAIAFFGVGDQWRPPFFPYIQNVGVLVFFVLSGFLIAHALVKQASSPNGGLSVFVVERFARIYTALIPALLLIALSDGLLILIGKHEHPNYFTTSAFLGTLGMFQNYSGPFRGALAVPSFGSAGHLWSLAVEWHIYMFAGGIFFMLTNRKWLPALLVALIFSSVPMQFFGTFTDGLHGSGLSYLWMLGFCTYFVARTNACCVVPKKVLLATAGALILIWLLATKPAEEYAPALYPLIAAAFLMMTVFTQRTHAFSARPKARNFVRKLADYSFSLYLVHYSLLYALNVLWIGNPILAAVVGVILCNLIAWLFGKYIEWRHHDVASYLKRIFGVGQPIFDHNKNL